MKLLVYSDLHLDMFPWDWKPSTQQMQGIDAVVLAGDIAEGTRGLVWARDTFPDTAIVYIDGNHEFYGHLHAIGAFVGEQIGMVGMGGTKHGDDPGSAVSVPARMSTGAVASQAASMRIIPAARAASGHRASIGQCRVTFMA